LKVLILGRYPRWDPKAWGGDIHSNRLAEHLAKKGCEVTFVNTGFTGVKDNIRFKKISYKVYRGTPFYPNPKDIIKIASDYDIIHAFSTRGYVFKWLKHNAKPLIQTQLVTRLKSLGISHPFGFLIRLKPYRFLAWYYEREACKNADIVTTTSSAMKLQIGREFNLTNKQIRLVPRGVNLDLFSLSPYPNEKIILTAGRLEKEKGIKFLIKSMKLVHTEFKEAKLWIAGDGRDKKELQKIASGMSMIRFLGRVPHVDMSKLYSKSSLFALMSPFEPFGAVLLEAMASGRPVIASKSGGPLDIVNEECGILIRANDVSQVADAIKKIFSDPELAETMGLKGRERVRSFFTWEKEANAYYKLYSELSL